MRKAERDKWVINALVDQFFQQHVLDLRAKDCLRLGECVANGIFVGEELVKRADWQAVSRGERLVVTASKPITAKTSSLAQSG
jgi:hypothetical protein